jgi:NAD(P)-dependent dehydrogenase (short-subunit alcohol dehydrogenase family)
MQDVKGKVAFITGGVSGIGLGIAKVFAANGIIPVMSYRNEDHRKAAAEYFEGRRQPARFIKLDVMDREGFARAADEVQRVFGKVHILVNNAGVSVFGPTDEATYDDYDWVMGVNFGGVVNGLVSFMPYLKKHGEEGHIVNVASMAAFLPGPQAGIYTASKYAIRGLTESLRDNLAPYKIGVSLMAPALTKSNAGTSGLGRPAKFANTKWDADPKMLAEFGKMFEAGMEPEEVGEKCLAGIRRNDLYILTHPENREEFVELTNAILAAWPNEPIPPQRAAIEEQRRAAKREAETKVIGVGDLSVKK